MKIGGSKWAFEPLSLFSDFSVGGVNSVNSFMCMLTLSLWVLLLLLVKSTFLECPTVDLKGFLDCVQFVQNSSEKQEEQHLWEIHGFTLTIHPSGSGNKEIKIKEVCDTH